MRSTQFDKKLVHAKINPTIPLRNVKTYQQWEFDTNECIQSSPGENQLRRYT